jgi:hypothetical protein
MPALLPSRPSGVIVATSRKHHELSDPRLPKPIRARPSPSGTRVAQILGRQPTTAISVLAFCHMMPPHHRPPASPDRYRPSSTAARDRKAPTCSPMARGMEGRRRRHRPGFAQRPLPAEAMGVGGGRRGGGWRLGKRPRRPRGGERTRMRANHFF